MILADIDRVESTVSKANQRTVNFIVHGQSYTGHLYLPKGTVRAGVVVIPGAAEKGLEDRRLIAFATALSRVDLAVFVPDLPSLRELEVNSGNIQEIEAAILFLAGRKEFAPQGRTGLVAFSYTAGPAVLAACKPSIASKISIILTIGGYYSLPDVLTFITTGDFQVNDAWQHIKPSPYGQWVFVKSNLRHLDDQADRALFRQMINRKKTDFDLSVDDLVQQLGLQGRSLYSFISNRDRRHVETLYADLPVAMRAEINRLDLASNDLDGLEASLILVHGYDDTIIPFSQSAELDQALPPGQADLYLVDG
ncbi:MAG: alpha/beta hydrolase, partial [Deltaproteobacteria bacterium]|nr:alpha/beta hydrolase [Deltaproteobacteria bacterium]